MAERVSYIVEYLESQDLSPGCLSIGDAITVADELDLRVSDVVIAEASAVTGLSCEEVLEHVLESFSHNLAAVELGLTEGRSYLLGDVGAELSKLVEEGHVIFDGGFVDKAICYTLAAQVGNHEIGLSPCAGTGDSCPYTGLLKAMLETGNSREKAARAIAVALKIGTIFRVGKTTTGCNMEGFGAGSAATAAGVIEFLGGEPKQIAKAIALAISPTIAVPCVPRTMVAGLCATHIGGAILIGYLAAQLALATNMPCDVDPDAMIAMAAAIHPVAAAGLNDVNIKYMHPFFITNEKVERCVSNSVKEAEKRERDGMAEHYRSEVRRLAKLAAPITRPFGEAVVGGSSLGVGSPANAGRIAHALARGKIEAVTIQLYPPLFARRAATVPGILMGTVYGASTDDAHAYKNVMSWIKRDGISVEIEEIDEYEVQRIMVKASLQDSMVHALNRGGGRLVLVDAKPSLSDAQEAARDLGIELVD